MSVSRVKNLSYYTTDFEKHIRDRLDVLRQNAYDAWVFRCLHWS